MFVRAANPVWYFVDLIGLGLNDEYYAFFLTNTFPYQPQMPFRDPQGVTVWGGDAIEFYPNGTLPDNLYFDPTLVYRIEIRHGNLQSDPLIYEINNFVPNGDGASTNTALQILSADNQASNTNFAEISFTSPLSLTTAGTYNIAPGWQLTLTGVGTTTLTQLIFAQGTVSTNPNTYTLNYALRVANVGWTTAVLFQRFNHNGAIFAGGAISMAITGRAQTVNELISLIYKPSDSGIATTVVADLLDTGNFQFVSGTMNLPATGNASPPNNSDLSTVAYVDMQVVLPPTGTVDLTDFQVVGQTTAIIGFAPQVQIPTVIPSYIQQSEERQIDHLFHYYQNSIVHLPKDSLLTGWNFGLNPFQFWPVAATNVAVNQYTADQTIIIQQNYVANVANTNNVSVGKGSFANQKGGLAVMPVTANNQFAILQYIDARTMAPYWSNFVSTLSSMLNVYVSSSANTLIKFKMRLIYTANAPSATSQLYPIASWTAGADPVFAAGVTAIVPENDPEYTYDNVLIGGFKNFPFNNISLPQSPGVDAVLGILVYTTVNMNQAIGDFIVFGDVSLTPNPFAIASNPQTYDQVLRQCQYYFAKTFPQGTVPDENAPAGFPGALAYQAILNAANTGVYLWQFPSIMRSQTPTMHYFDPILVTSSLWYNRDNSAPSGASSTSNISDRGVLVGNGGDIADSTGDIIYIHATADARLGV